MFEDLFLKGYKFKVAGVNLEPSYYEYKDGAVYCYNRYIGYFQHPKRLFEIGLALEGFVNEGLKVIVLPRSTDIKKIKK